MGERGGDAERAMVASAAGDGDADGRDGAAPPIRDARLSAADCETGRADDDAKERGALAPPPPSARPSGARASDADALSAGPGPTRSGGPDCAIAA